MIPVIHFWMNYECVLYIWTTESIFLPSSVTQFKVDLHFPRVWNATQTWDMTFGASKVEVNIFFSYIDFVNGIHMYMYTLHEHVHLRSSYMYMYV